LNEATKNLTRQEREVVDVKYAGKRFGYMTEIERGLAAHKMLLVIHTLTGWVLPTELFLDILVKQLEKKLKESYFTLNEEEVEYAFRNRGIDVKDWGKEINLTLVDEILIPYLETRFELSKIEESIKHKHQIEDKKSLTDDEWEEWLNDIRTYKFEFIPTSCYDYLLRVNKINPSKEEKNECLEKAINILTLELSIDETRIRDFNDFIQMKNTGVVTGRFLDTLVVISKRLIIKKYLDAL